MLIDSYPKKLEQRVSTAALKKKPETWNIIPRHFTKPGNEKNKQASSYRLLGVKILDFILHSEAPTS